MQSIKAIIPWFLIISRCLSGFLFAFFGFFETINFSIIITVNILFHIGFWGDLFDGILARKWELDSTTLRMSDSLADLFFWLGITIHIYFNYPLMLSMIQFGLLTIGSIVLLEYLICFLKFKKTPSAHAIFGKFWGILLYLLFALVLSGFVPIMFGVIVFIIGIIARLDSLFIYIILNKWTHDIPSSYHAMLINKNINFNRISLFNSTDKSQ